MAKKPVRALVTGAAGGGGWTPLHHTAEEGLEDTVKLLLSQGANALQMNADGKTPLDIARAKDFSNVVRAIEVAKPLMVIASWTPNLEEPKNNKPDPSVKIFDNATKSSIVFAPEKRGDKEQLQRFYNACKGNPQAIRPAFPHNNSRTPVVQPTAPPETELEDFELKMAKRASILSATAEAATYNEANASSSFVDRSSPTVENLPDRTAEREEDGCVICLDAPVEGVFVPCGHGGCMSLFGEVQSQKRELPCLSCGGQPGYKDFC